MVTMVTMHTSISWAAETFWRHLIIRVRRVKTCFTEHSERCI